jgi:hypothetical protein
MKILSCGATSLQKHTAPKTLPVAGQNGIARNASVSHKHLKKPFFITVKVVEKA